MNASSPSPAALPSESPSAKPHRSPLRKVWRVLRVLIFVAVCLATLACLFNAEENWRAGRVWQKCRADLLARGEKLDLKEMLPPPVPAEQNFAATPLLAGVLNHKEPRNPLDYRLNHEEKEPFRGSWRLGQPLDLQGWSNYYRGAHGPAAAAPTPGAAILEALGRYEAAMAELRAATQKPHAQFSIQWKDDPMALLLPQIAFSKSLAQTMTLHASAALAAGRGGEALDDLKVNWRLMEALNGQPLLVVYLVQIAVHEISLQPVWEGLAARRWDEAQLAMLDQELSRLDFIRDSARALRGERAFMNAILDQMIRTPWQTRLAEDARAKSGSEEELSAPVRVLFPRWLIRRSQALLNQYQQDMIDALDKPPRQSETTSPLDSGVTNLWSQRFAKSSPYNTLAKALAGALNTIVPKAVQAQTTLSLARTACALERYRLAHGAYPETLEQLVPQFLPKVPPDLYAANGPAPLRYRLDTDAPFLLYSVGPNRVDDGGRVEKRTSGGVDLAKGDWVWSYPASAR
jgi:hypothetical protein